MNEFSEERIPHSESDADLTNPLNLLRLDKSEIFEYPLYELRLCARTDRLVEGEP